MSLKNPTINAEHAELAENSLGTLALRSLRFTSFSGRLVFLAVLLTVSALAVVPAFAATSVPQRADEPDPPGVEAPVAPANQPLTAFQPASPALPPPDHRCLTGHTICVDKTTRRLRYVQDGQVVLTMTVRFGSLGQPTREGLFHVSWKDIRHVSHQFPGLPMPYSLFFSRGEAVHYSPDFARYGYHGHSHGCVETRNHTLTAQLFDLVRTGDKVVVYRGPRPAPTPPAVPNAPTAPPSTPPTTPAAPTDRTTGA